MSLTEECVTFEDALLALPDSKLQHLSGATIPLLCYWKNPTPVIEETCYSLYLEPPQNHSIFFEYAVPSLIADEAHSCSDVMMISNELVVAFEGRRGRLQDETVTEWIATGDHCQRKAVLQHWLSLIQPFAKNELKVDRFHDVSCQLLQSISSACSIPSKKHAVVYQVFIEAGALYPPLFAYKNELDRLSQLIQPSEHLMFKVEVPIGIKPTQHHVQLVKKLKNSTPESIPNPIRSTVVKHDIFDIFPEGTSVTWNVDKSNEKALFDYRESDFE